MMKYFRTEEFACKCGCGKADISEELVKRIERARSFAGVPFIITSGCRGKNHNKKVGGVKDSSHLQGLAVDISISNESKSAILMALGKCFNRIGVSNDFVHVDVDMTKPSKMWCY